MKNVTCFLMLFFIFLVPYYSFSQTDTIQSRVILIGDAGDFYGGKHPVIGAVKSRIKFDSKTTVVFLGDNLYMTGLPDESYRDYDKRKAVLDTQVSIADNTPAKVFFIPGNHDWNRGGKGGWDNVRRQQQYIDNFLGQGKNVDFEPKDGCPGPFETSLSQDVILLIIDSQWWLHPYEKPGIESECDYKTKEEVVSQIEDILSRNSRKLVLFATHHPFKSYGVHGGDFRLKQHVFPLTEKWPKLYFPLPGLGSIYPIARGTFGTPQDIRHPNYQDMINEVQKVVKKFPNVIFVSGHEHNLQLIKDSSYNYIISGSGTKKTRVSKNKNSPFNAQENGFATLEISTNKNVRVDFYTVQGDSSKNAYTANLLNFSKLSKELTDSLNVKSEAVAFKDSAVVAINKDYDSVSAVHRIILGNNYRKGWATPVHLKVFNISKEKGGFTIVGLGGGKQTKALRLKDKRGEEWVLRSVNKDPQGALPENFRNSVAQHVVQDMLSASNPFGALAVPDLAKAAHIVAASPTYYFVPDDPALGYYRALFANSVCALEQREPTPDTTDTKSTAKVINQLYDDNDNHVDQRATLTARLLDVLTGDFDRHFDQWRFGTRDTGKGKIYYPIPRDRDQVFFKGDGVLMYGVSRNLLPYLGGFKKDIERIKWLNYGARDFDRLFLNELSREDWLRITEEFKNNITDGVIDKAVKKLPPNIFALNGQTIIDKLKGRRNHLTKAALKYYDYISKDVNVVGSNKKEYFKVIGVGNNLQVKVFKRTTSNDSAAVIYNRMFDSKHTDEIRLYGLNGDDIFEVDDQAKSKIRIRIVGGNGNDTFNVRGKNRNDIYDLTTQNNYIIQHNKSRIRTSSKPEVNKYEATGFRYNIYRFPRLNLGYNIEDKLLLGIGGIYRTFRFRKEPYSTQQKLTTLYALSRKSYQLKYQGEFNQVIGNTDILLNGEIVNPVLNNFFGLGNETVIMNEHNLEYYRVRYKYTQAEVLFRQRPFNVLSIAAGPAFYHYRNDYKDNKNRILSTPSLIGLDSANVYSTKTYLGGKLGFLINNLNSELLPTRGVYWNTNLTVLAGMQKTSNPLTRLTSDLTLYSSFSDLAKLIIVTRVGGGRIYSKNYEYFQALNLGANNFLRGFRKNRFSGDAVAYGGVEFRLKLFDSKSYLLPGSVGLIGFDEVGRVWVKNEVSKKWHNSFGGGFYYAAFNVALFSATVGFSPEERIFNFSIGSKFNITF